MAQAQVSGYQTESYAPRERKPSAVELGPGGGVVELSDLSSENQALAQFGYKPVYTYPLIIGLQKIGKSVDGLWYSTTASLSAIQCHQTSAIPPERV